jgi:chromosome segregation ATPase
LIEDLKKKSIPNQITKYEKDQLAEYKKWKEAFKDVKKDPAEIRKDYDNYKNRLNNAINNLTKEQEKNKALKTELKNKETDKSNLFEKAVEDKLREVVIGEEWQRPYLIRALEKFLTWKGDENPEKRKVAFKY